MIPPLFEYRFQIKQRDEIMPAIFDLLYREYCRARLAEMRKQLLISPERHEVPDRLAMQRIVLALLQQAAVEIITQDEPLNH